MKTGLFFFLLRLAKDRRARGHRLLARLLRDEAGAWLISTTLMLPVLIGVAGVGTEGGMLFYQHRSLQSAADAAAYSAAISYSNSTSADITTQAQAVVASYGFTLGTGTNQANVTATATTFATLPAVQVTISRPQTAIFSSILFSVLPNSVSATAVLNGGGSNPAGTCILAFGNTSTGNNAPDAIQLQGNASINVPGCGMFSDSTDCVSGSFSESLGGNAAIAAGYLGSAGCMTIFGHAQVNLPGGVTCNSSNSTACTQGDATVSNPYAGVTMPSLPAPPCVNQPSGSNITLAAGRYCGLNANGTNITLTGGIYILDCSASTCPSAQGTSSMLIVKNATLTDSGAGSTLVFTCSTCSSASQWPSNGVDVLANGNVSLTAPTSGSTAGFVMMGDPAMPLGTAFDNHSNPTAALSGTVYVPNGAFNWGGTPTSGTGNPCLQFVVNTISLYGNSTFGSSGCTLAGSGSGGQQPIASTVTLVD